ncbi:MAG: hypothetical protein GX454_12490 [Brooklawnia sp.]|nr:hypothetical protein [Brooklawnia sp.]
MTMIDGAKERLAAGFERSLSVQQAVARTSVDRLRRVHPDHTPKELVRELNRWYLSAVTIAGAGTGMAAALPGAGRAMGVPAAFADTLAFTEASVLYVLSVAEVHDLHPEDVERRKLLVMSVMLGDSAVGALHAGVGKTAPHWARKIVNTIPMEAINKANKVLGPRFITKYGERQGVLVLGKQLPRGLGAVFGSGANHLVGRGIVASTHEIFGEPASEWGGQPPRAEGAWWTRGRR